jgi:signal transduction histidine kinase
MESPSGIPLADFLRQAVEDFRSATLISTPISFECDQHAVNGIGIPSLLKRAVTNLLDNAVKYSAPGAPVVLRLQQEDGMAVIRVEDQGQGIPEEDIPFLKEPFFRASNAVGIPGTGLGLAIANEAMQRMGGNIAHSNRLGGGTIFTMRFPLLRGEVTDGTCREPRPGYPTSPPRSA